jgi:phenylpropionate dioxygenase-like ring-hydroxylating dioxygenase large terminal subunit
MSTNERGRFDGRPAGETSGTDGFDWGPMPRNARMLEDRSLRTYARKETTPRFPFPVPNGWFIVATAAELPAKGVTALHYFGRDLVLFRGAGGKPYLMDAYCPHLGAHLGVGSRVDGDSLRCAFHGWRFQGESGRCDDVPYDDIAHIPKTAATRSYPVVERNQMIWAWHHGADEPPFYEVPEVDEFTDPDFQPIVLREFEVATCAQEMAENNVDTVHFKYVHGTPSVPEEEFLVDGHYKRSVGMNGNFIREGYGLGLGVLRVKNYVTFISSTTPIDTEHVHVRWIFTAPEKGNPQATFKAAESFTSAVSQDIPIWENKIYKAPPVLRASEKAVTEQRRWADQFYTWPEGKRPANLK